MRVVRAGGVTHPLLVAFVLLALLPIAPTPATTAASHSGERHAWSDPATWNGAIPAAGEVVTIPEGTTVVLDVSPPPLGGLTIDGTLLFADKDLELQTEWIVVHGRLQVGTPERPFLHRAVITLRDERPSEDILGMGDRVIGVVGGQLDLHGQPPGPGWTRLADTTVAGSDYLVLERPVAWQPGDQIVVASTDFDPWQTETATIRRIEGQTVELERPLAFSHWGEIQTYGAWTLDERAEVGLLSRNIVVQADESAETYGFGGHLMVMDGEARLSAVELTRMGQRGQLARYPIHFHLLGDAPDSFVVDASIHHTYNRCLTIHGTNRLRIERNVAFDAPGHCFFLEDGAETGNILSGNLGLLTRRPAAGDALLPSDGTPATFWITNPDNVLRNNVAGGSEGTGFWYALPEHPLGLSRSQENDERVWPRRTPLTEFAGNVAHSNGFRGLNVDEGPREDGSVEVTFYYPRQDPIPPKEGEAEPAPAVADFTRFSAFKNRERGVWLRGANLRISESVLADSAVGATFAAVETYVDDSLFVGESANRGAPVDGEPAGSDGRALPMPWAPDFPIRGFEFYDGPVGARDVAFAGFFPDDRRQASALGVLNPNAFPLNPASFVSDLTWLDDSHRLYFTVPDPDHDGDKGALFVDLDGSLTGRPGVSVVADIPFLRDGRCEAAPAWNGAICDERFDELIIERFDDDPRERGPLVVERLAGSSTRLVGVPPGEAGRPADYFQAPVTGGDSYTLTFSQSTPERLRFSYIAYGGGQAVTLRFSLDDPIFLYEAYLPDADFAIPLVDNRAALDASPETAAFQDGTMLYVKLVAGDDAYVAVDICARELCA